MKAISLLLISLAGACAISIPSNPTLRPSIASFNLKNRALAPIGSLGLKGGTDIIQDEIRISPQFSLRATGSIMALYALLSFPDLPIPLMDLGGKLHNSRSSFFYNSLDLDTPTFKLAKSWVSHAYAWIAAANFILAERATIPVQKDMCKTNAALQLLGIINALSNNEPWQAGKHIFLAITGALNAMSGFDLIYS